MLIDLWSVWTVIIITMDHPVAILAQGSSSFDARQVPFHCVRELQKLVLWLASAPASLVSGWLSNQKSQLASASHRTSCGFQPPPAQVAPAALFARPCQSAANPRGNSCWAVLELHYCLARLLAAAAAALLATTIGPAAFLERQWPLLHLIQAGALAAIAISADSLPVDGSSSSGSSR